MACEESLVERILLNWGGPPSSNVSLYRYGTSFQSGGGTFMSAAASSVGASSPPPCAGAADPALLAPGSGRAPPTLPSSGSAQAGMPTLLLPRLPAWQESDEAMIPAGSGPGGTGSRLGGTGHGPVRQRRLGRRGSADE